MFRRVLVLGTITTSHVATDHAHAEVHPRVAKLYAFFADRDVLWMDVADLIFVCARCFFHPFILSYSKREAR